MDIEQFKKALLDLHKLYLSGLLSKAQYNFFGLRRSKEQLHSDKLQMLSPMFEAEEILLIAPELPEDFAPFLVKFAAAWITERGFFPDKEKAWGIVNKYCRSNITCTNDITSFINSSTSFVDYMNRMQNLSSNELKSVEVEEELVRKYFDDIDPKVVRETIFYNQGNKNELTQVYLSVQPRLMKEFMSCNYAKKTTPASPAR